MLQPPNTANVSSSSYVPPVDPIAPLRAALRGHYDIEREIGQGAFATVYLARDLKHERKVALKVLNADPNSDVGELRFIREIRTLARLQHPNILPLHDSGHVEALLYYVMPYVSGDTLRDRIDRERQMSVDAACSIAREVADGLAYAHAQGVIHRDIKPENILLSTGHPIIADFGIARAIDLAGVRQITKTGSQSPGTPAYMSPEQLLGEKGVDNRSDIYSLGCVLFEMLTGKPPFAGKEGFVKRFTEPPPKASTLRKGLPSWLDDAIAVALEREPRNRYPTAKEFVAALCAPTALDGAHPIPGNLRAGDQSFGSKPLERSNPANLLQPQPLPRDLPESVAPSADKQVPSAVTFPPLRLTPRRVAIAVGGLLAGVVALVLVEGRAKFLNAFSSVPAMDSTRFVILPLANQGGTDLGGKVAEHLYDSFSRWRGIHLVADTRVAQAISDRGGSPATENEALSLARALGAGKLVWGQATGRLGRVRVSVHLYDVATNESRDEFVFFDTTADGRIYSPAAMRLLQVPDRPRAADGGDGLTDSFTAWYAYGRGHIALKKWDLPAAEREFRTAIGADPSYAPARLWLAQLLAWKTAQQRGEWQELAMRSAGEQSKLSQRDRSILSALVAMSAQKYPDACQMYAGLTRVDSLDFAGWYGLGECQYLDQQVIASKASPSGWRFRSSYHQAALHYMRALRLEPGAHTIFAFDRLQNLMPTASTQIRTGRGPAPDRELFAAYPGLVGDSLLFIPYSVAEFQNLSPRAINTRQSAALARDALLLREFATDWTREAPTSPDAFEALGDVLDGGAGVFDLGPTKSSALGALQRARSLSSASDQRLRIAAREVWVHFKNSEFVAARALADSIFNEYARDGNADPRSMIGLAAITGRLKKTGELSRSSGEWIPRVSMEVPPAIGPEAGQFFAMAALGVCGPAFKSAERELDQKLDSFVADDQKDALRAAIKARPLSMISPCTDGESALRIGNSVGRIGRLQQAYASKDVRRLRALLDTAIAELKLRPPGDVSFDYTYQLSWLRAASGDSTGALRQLERSLNALPAVSTRSLRQAAMAGAALRSMALYAELASRQGEHESAQRWARAVVVLWSGADPLLQGSVSRMRSLAQIAPTQ